MCAIMFSPRRLQSTSNESENNKTKSLLHYGMGACKAIPWKLAALRETELVHTTCGCKCTHPIKFVFSSRTRNERPTHCSFYLTSLSGASGKRDKFSTSFVGGHVAGILNEVKCCGERPQRFGALGGLFRSLDA